MEGEKAQEINKTRDSALEIVYLEGSMKIKTGDSVDIHSISLLSRKESNVSRN